MNDKLRSLKTKFKSARDKTPNPLPKVESKAFEFIAREGFNKFLKKHDMLLFANQNPKEKVPTFQEILNNISYSVLKLPNQPWEISYSYKNSQGITKVRLHNKFKKNRPSLVFHHGLGAISRPKLQLRLIADTKIKTKFNVFSILASNHESSQKVIKSCVNNFVNLASTTCASVLAVNEIVNFHKNNANTKIAITGLSLGGVVSSLHYFYFNTANYYFPIVSYPNLGSALTKTKGYKHVVNNYKSISKNKSIINSFSIPKEFLSRPKNKIYPTLGKFDEIFNYEDTQKFWKGYETITFDTGHFSIFSKGKEVRKLILDKVFEN